ncbi:hypothetical protein BT69DRAFT_1291451, partial [Atractiella rhizophila]
VFKAIGFLVQAVNLSKAASGYYEARSRWRLARLLFLLCQYDLAREEIIQARQLFTDCFATSDVDHCNNVLLVLGQTKRL